MAREKLAGKVAIVTGASSGAGWASARQLAAQGVRLCVTARRQSALEALREEVIESGGECLVVAGDVTRDEDVQRVVDTCLQHYGRLDLLVNSAGVQIYGYFDRLEWRQIERVFDVTCFGYFRFARAVLPHFRARNEGQIINVLSMLSLGGAPLLSAYSAAKHALWGWAQCLELELYRTGISVSNVMAPSIATPMFDHAPTQFGRAPRPVPPTYSPDVVARAVVRLARSRKSKSIPVFLQGGLIVFINRHLTKLGSYFLGHLGERLQMSDAHIDRPEGNLFRPMAQGVGPRGSVPPTPKWKLWGSTTAALLLLGAGAAGLRMGARRALG